MEEIVPGQYTSYSPLARLACAAFGLAAPTGATSEFPFPGRYLRILRAAVPLPAIGKTLRLRSGSVPVGNEACRRFPPDRLTEKHERNEIGKARQRHGSAPVARYEHLATSGVHEVAGPGGQPNLLLHHALHLLFDLLPHLRGEIGVLLRTPTASVHGDARVDVDR